MESLQLRADRSIIMFMVKEFLEGVREDIKNDISSMKSEIVKHEKTIKSNTIVTTVKTEKDYQDLKKKKTDISLISDYSFRNQNTGNYDSFESSGKLGYLENKELKKRILGYYHEANPALIKIENKYDENVDKMLEIMPKYKENKDLLFDPYFQQTINFQKIYSKNLVKFYKLVSQESEKTLKMIDEELKK